MAMNEQIQEQGQLPLLSLYESLQAAGPGSSSGSGAASGLLWTLQPHSSERAAANPAADLPHFTGHAASIMAAAMQTQSRGKAHFDHEDYCGRCQCPGVLMCCDYCPRAFHQTCMGFAMHSVADPWKCPMCTSCETIAHLYHLLQQHDLKSVVQLEDRIVTDAVLVSTFSGHDSSAAAALYGVLAYAYEMSRVLGKKYSQVEYEKAAYYYTRSLQTSEAISDFAGQLATLPRMASVFERLGKTLEASIMRNNASVTEEKCAAAARAVSLLQAHPWQGSTVFVAPTVAATSNPVDAAAALAAGASNVREVRIGGRGKDGARGVAMRGGALADRKCTARDAVARTTAAAAYCAAGGGGGLSAADLQACSRATAPRTRQKSVGFWRMVSTSKVLGPSAQHEGQTACTTTDKWESFALTSQRVDSWVSDKCVSVSQNKVVRSHHKKRPEDLLKNLQKAREEVLFRETGVAPPVPRPPRCQKRVRVDVGGDGVASHLLGCALEEVQQQVRARAEEKEAELLRLKQVDKEKQAAT